MIYLAEKAIDKNTNVIKGISYAEIATVLDKKKNSLTTVLKRIKFADKLININALSSGPGATIDIYLHPLLIKSYRILVKENIIDPNNTESSVTSSITSSVTNDSSSSRSIFFKEETTITKPKILEEIDIQWDIESLELHEGQVNQLITLLNQGRVTESLLRLTLSEVAFHKENGGGFKKDPISALFHGLRTGHGFKSTIREEIEEKRKNDIEKQLVEKQRAEEQRLDADYQPWRESLSEEEKTEILKRFNALERSEQIQEVMLKNHFKRSL